jgi:putative phosphoribosyl transferase
MIYQTRQQAATLLAAKIKNELSETKDLFVFSIPRGGVVVGAQLSRELHCPHDIVVTKKLRAPQQEELAIGAIGLHQKSLYLDQNMVTSLGIDKEYLDQEIKNRQVEIKRRLQTYRGNKPQVDLSHKTVIVTDDGVATGATMISALREIKARSPKKLIAAIPVIAQDTVSKIKQEGDQIIYLQSLSEFWAVGQWYEDFPQLDDQEVINILQI